MSISEWLKRYRKTTKVASLVISSGTFVYYQVFHTCNYFNKVINTNVLDREKKYVPEYIYIDDPLYESQIEKFRRKERQYFFGLLQLWNNLQHSMAWRLLWLCRHGNIKQRNYALKRLAGFKNNKNWDCLKLAQALDMNTAVLLARTYGADLRYFLPPPIHIRRNALGCDQLPYKFKDMITALSCQQPHACIEHFLTTYFSNLQDQNVEDAYVPPNKNCSNDKKLSIYCLDALHHHISLFHNEVYNKDLSSKVLIEKGLLGCIAEVLVRYPGDSEVDLAVVRILTVLSIHKNLLKDFFQNGIIGHLTRLLKSSDVRLSSSAAVCLSNLSGEYKYTPGLYLLHPIYRTTQPHKCDTLLVHGLRGGVFVTWRQRDRKCDAPIGIIDVTISECETCDKPHLPLHVSDEDFREVLEDLMVLEDEALLSDFEVVLHDLPISAKRETVSSSSYTAKNKRLTLIKEKKDSCTYSFCWPKDWLPQDCPHLRVLGVNYWSSLSEWLERCPLQTAEISKRAAELAPTLVTAGVGKKDTPVVWLAHSMGGLIVKQLLIDAANSDDERYKKLSSNTKAVMFYSTPHKGSALANMPRAASAILWPSNDVRQLQQNSPVLLKMNHKFIQLAESNNWETISFAETQPTLVTAFKVPIHFVESESADLGRGVYYEMPLDHLSICKPATRQSILYTAVLDVLERVTCRKRQPNTIQRMINIFDKTLISKRLLAIDDKNNNNNENLSWFNQVLLDVFTNGFTD